MSTAEKGGAYFREDTVHDCMDSANVCDDPYPTGYGIVATPYQITYMDVTTHYHNIVIAILFLQSPSFTDPSLHVSDSSSLESRSQGLINRGCFLISPSSTTASSPPANSYFTSKRGDIVASECLTALMNTAAAPTDGLTSVTPTTAHTKGDSMHTKSITQLSSLTPRPLPRFQTVCSRE